MKATIPNRRQHDQTQRDMKEVTTVDSERHRQDKPQCGILAGVRTREVAGLNDTCVDMLEGTWAVMLEE